MGLVSIAKFMYVHEAQVAKSLLDAEGIRASIANEHIATQNWLYTTAVGGIELVVPEEDAEVARALLAQTYSHEEIIKESEASDKKHVEVSDACPKCGSEPINYVVTGKIGIFLSWLALGSPIFPLGKRLRCEKCGETWKP